MRQKKSMRRYLRLSLRKKRESSVVISRLLLWYIYLNSLKEQRRIGKEPNFQLRSREMVPLSSKSAGMHNNKMQITKYLRFPFLHFRQQFYRMRNTEAFVASSLPFLLLLLLRSLSNTVKETRNATRRSIGFSSRLIYPIPCSISLDSSSVTRSFLSCSNNSRSAL